MDTFIEYIFFCRFMLKLEDSKTILLKNAFM